MKINSAFTIKASIKNTNANPLATLVILKTHDSFNQVYPRYSEEIIYLDPFQEKELTFHFILPDLTQAMSFSYILANQYKDVEGKVNIYPNDGLYEDAFFVIPPIFYFKDNQIILSFDIINHTNKQKTIKLDYNYCGIPSTETQVISKQTSETFVKGFDKTDSCELDFLMSGDYDYSKSILVYPTQEIKIIDEVTNISSGSNVDANYDNNQPKDIWSDINKMKVVEQSDSKGYAGYVLLGLFVIGIILFIVFKPKKKINNLTHI
jgi:hypothetical protein